jgi:hypothetical protein
MTINYYTRSAYGITRAYVVDGDGVIKNALRLLTGGQLSMTADTRQGLELLGHKLEQVEDPEGVRVV